MVCVPAAFAQTSTTAVPLDTVIGGDVQVRLPATAENMAETLASLARATGVLIGFETAMDEPSKDSGHSGWSPRGLTLAQALDQVVATDARYEWRERNGVIHVRPKTAFADAGHFLNTRVDRFEVKEALPLHATFEVHRIFRPGCVIRHPIYTDDREEYLSGEPPALRELVSVSLRNVTVLDVLDEVIKAHGRLAWNLTYRLPADVTPPAPAKYEYAIFSFFDRPSVGGWWRMCANHEEE